MNIIEEIDGQFFFHKDVFIETLFLITRIVNKDMSNNSYLNKLLFLEME